MSEIINIKSKIIKFFENKNCKFVYVLGSLAKPEYFHKESDIDIGVYFEKVDSSFNYLNLYHELSEYLGTQRDIDLIILNSADIIIVSQTLNNGELLFSNDDRFLIEYRVRKMSEYIDFKVSRKIVEDKILDD